MIKVTRDAHVERYYPDVLAGAKEFKAIANAENPEYTLIYDVAWEWFANTFVFHADEAGIRRWEKMLSIAPESDATLEDRRTAIYMAINGTLPYTERSFKNLCDGLYWEDAVIPEVSPNDYELKLVVDRDMLRRTPALLRYARLIVPANLTIKATHETPVDWKIYVGGVKQVKKAITIYPQGTDGEETGATWYAGVAARYADDVELYSEKRKTATNTGYIGGVVRIRKKSEIGK